MNFNFNWFRLNKKEREELKQLREEKWARANEREEDQIVIATLQNQLLEEIKPYKGLVFMGTSIVVIFQDDTSVVLPCNDTQRIAVENANSKEEILNILRVPEKDVEIKEVDVFHEEEKIEAISVIEKYPDFEVKDGKIYMVGISVKIPDCISGAFVELLERIEKNQYLISGDCTTSQRYEWTNEVEDLESSFIGLKKFWCHLCTNPIDYSREDALKFVQSNDIRLSSEGNLILYRNFIKIGEDKEYVRFISENYFRIKGQKKSPKNYTVYDFEGDENYKIIKSQKVCEESFQNENYTVLGNLSDLYSTLSSIESNKYTSWHNKGRYVVSVNSLYKIDENIEKLNTGRYACHGGALHACNNKYDYSSFGDEKMIVLVNPSKILTIPSADSGKLTVSEMWVACTNPNKIGVHFEGGLDNIEDEYNKLIMEEYKEVLLSKNLDKLSINEDKPKINVEDLDSIISILSNKVILV